MMLKDYSPMHHKCVGNSITVQDAELSIPDYLSLVNSGQRPPVHRTEYQSDLKSQLTFEDMDMTRTPSIDLYDLLPTVEASLSRRTKSNTVKADKVLKTAENGDDERSEEEPASDVVEPKTP